MNLQVTRDFRRLILAVSMVIAFGCSLNLAAPTPLPPQIIVVTATGGAGPPGQQPPSATLESIPTSAPTETLTLVPTSTATVTATPTPPPLTMTAGQDLSCVKGPKWSLYDWVALIRTGETVTLLARAPTEWGEYYYVRLGNGTECWAFGGSSTKSGDTSKLPIKEAPPTPTASLNYSVSFLSTTNCGGNYTFRFQVKNTGTITLESIRIVVTDNTTATTFTHQLDSFRGFNVCSEENNKPSLTPGEGAIVSNTNPGHLNYNPAGHSITATFTICSADGLGGTCVNRTINFTA